MNEDNVMPNDGAYFQPTAEPEDQKIDKQKEKGKLLEALPLVKDIIAHFDERIAYLKSTEAIPNDVRLLPEQFMHTVNANDLAKNFLVSEKEYLEGLLEQYLKNR